MTASGVGGQVEGPAGGGGTTTCYRHPKREAGVRCVRCERYICGDCMIQAAVGFQCPECVREGQKNTRHARTIAGARVGAGSMRPGLGQVTTVLIVINVVMFLLEQTSPNFEARFTDVGVAVCSTSDHPAQLYLCGGLLDHQYYRLITAAFLHVNFIHIAMNMYALFWLGPMIERVFGRWRFVAFYLVTGIVGNVVAFVIAGPFDASEGASGALYGLFAAMWVVAHRLRADTGQITAVIALNLVLSFAIPRISWQAHVGGLVAGAILTWVFVNAPQRWRAHAQVASLVGMLVIAGAVFAAFAPALPSGIRF